MEGKMESSKNSEQGLQYFPFEIEKYQIFKTFCNFVAGLQPHVNYFLCLFIFLSFYVCRRNFNNDDFKGFACLKTFVGTFLSFLLFLMTVPLGIVLFPLLGCYRSFVHLYLQRTLKHSFGGLLVGPDVMWALESPTSKSIINVLAIIEVRKQSSNLRRRLQEESEDCVEGKHLLKLVRKIALSRLMASPPPFPKLLYRRRNSMLGYFYWEQSFDKSVETFVRPLSLTGELAGKGGISLQELKSLIACHCNDNLPDDNSAGWEILVGAEPIKDSRSNHYRKVLKFPVVFRVHHSLGDGVSLMRLLLECLADRDKMVKSEEKPRGWLQTNRFHESEDQEYDKSIDASFDDVRSKIDEAVFEDAETNVQPPVSVTPDLQITLDYGSLEDSSIKFRKSEFDERERLSPTSDQGCENIKKNRSGSFRLVKLSPFRSMKPGPGSPTKNLLEKKNSYSPIKGLVPGSVMSKLPLIRKLSNRNKPDLKMEKDEEPTIKTRLSNLRMFSGKPDENTKTCVVLPQPRGCIDGISFSDNEVYGVSPRDSNVVSSLNLNRGSTVFYYSKSKQDLVEKDSKPLLPPVNIIRKSASTSAMPDTYQTPKLLETSFDVLNQIQTVEISRGNSSPKKDPVPKLTTVGITYVKSEEVQKKKESAPELPRISVTPEPADPMFKKCHYYKRSDAISEVEDERKTQNKLEEKKEEITEESKNGFKFTALVQKAWSVCLMLLCFAIVICVSVMNALIALLKIADTHFCRLVMILKLCYVSPYALCCQTATQNKDELLFGKVLSGEKVVGFFTEEENISSEKQLLKTIRRIREKLGKDVKFSDVLFTCLSRSLETFYKSHGVMVPHLINVVVPARMDIDDLSKGAQTTAVYQTEKLRAKVTRLHSSRKALKKPFRLRDMSFSTSTESEDDSAHIRLKAEKIHDCMSRPTQVTQRLTLDNKFTVALLRLPVRGNDNEDGGFDRLQRVKPFCDELRSAPDYYLNYWLLRFVSHLLPLPLLQPLIASAQSSLVVSNLPGPEDLVDLGGNNLRNIVFWIPNRGETGVGISILSYCGRLNLGIMADKALIPSQTDAQEIINALVREVYDLELQLGLTTHRTANTLVQ